MRYKTAGIDLSEIGKRICIERSKQKLSQDDLIGQLRLHGKAISRNTLSKIENGDIHGLDLDLLIALCNIFDCDMGYLLCEYNERTRVAAEICHETGLSEAAVGMLAAQLQVQKSLPRVLHDGLLPIEVLSKLICDGAEFWRVLYNLSFITSSTVRSFDTEADFFNAYLQVPLSEAGVDTRPFADPMGDTHVASASLHFGNAIRRIIEEEKPKKSS